MTASEPTRRARGGDIDDGRKVDLCLDCQWVTPVGFSTAVDRARQTQRHLEDSHGLVVCR